MVTRCLQVTLTSVAVRLDFKLDEGFESVHPNEKNPEVP